MTKRLMCPECGFRTDTHMWSEGKTCPDCGDAEMEVE